MTRSSVVSASRWLVSARVDGEVLAARAEDGPLTLLLVSGPEGYSVAEIEGWLAELIGVASDSREEPADAPLPGLLHRALTGLLFSHAELWERSPAHQPCSVACLASGSSVAFGWVGEAQACVWVGDEPIAPLWVRVRDSGGREAHALTLDPTQPARVVLEWSSTAADGRARRAEVTAEWQPAPANALAAGLPEPQPEPSAPAKIGTAATRARPERRPWRFRGWVNLLGIGSDAPEKIAPPAASEVEPEAPVPAAPPDAALEIPGVPGRIPPTPEPESLTARTAPLDTDSGPRKAPAAEPVTVAALAEASPVTESGAAIADAPPGPGPLDHAPLESHPAETVIEFPSDEPAPVPEEQVIEFAAAQPAPAAEPALAAVPEEDWEAAPVRPVPRRMLRQDWPEEPERRPPWKRIGIVAGVVLLLFAVGWMVGSGGSRGRHEGPFAWIGRAFDVVGLGPGRFVLVVDSQPQGAWVSVDGRELGQRTPATVELRPGSHQVSLSLQGLGSAAYTVRGGRGGHVPLNGLLWGSLQIATADPGVPVVVTVDGVARGVAPVTVEGLAPGIHKVEFAGPGIGGWEQTAQVRIHQTTEIVTRPLATPPTGYLEVRATLTDEGEPQPLSGAKVWLDGEPRGTTPLRLELPRGPHSVRVAYRGEESPVQLVELPGGNVRFATFELGAVAFPPRVVAAPLPPKLALDRPTVVSASLQGVAAGDVKEMWLHVSTPEGAWRRHPMTQLRSPGSTAGAAVFPLAAFDARGRARWYVSALVATGDEHFTEIFTVQSAGR